MSDKNTKQESKILDTEIQLIKDEKVSLVDSINYQPSRYNHFINNNTNPIKDNKHDYNNQIRINEFNTFPFLNKIQNQETLINEDTEQKLKTALKQIK